MKVCLFGESPNDTGAVRKLLSKRFPKLQCTSFGGTMPGSHVDNKRRASAALRAKVKTEPDIKAIIFIRDLDAPKSNLSALKNRQDWFNTLSKEHSGINIFLLHIQQAEALLLADIAVVNEHYGVKMKYDKNPELEANPKQVLKDGTYKGKSKYTENDTPALYPLLDYDKLVKRVPYFKAFNEEVEGLLIKGKKR